MLTPSSDLAGLDTAGSELRPTHPPVTLQPPDDHQLSVRDAAAAGDAN